jgi:hypothetical protein
MQIGWVRRTLPRHHSFPSGREKPQVIESGQITSGVIGCTFSASTELKIEHLVDHEEKKDFSPEHAS